MNKLGKKVRHQITLNNQCIKEHLEIKINILTKKPHHFKKVNQFFCQININPILTKL
jgi:hypothetical protein